MIQPNKGDKVTIKYRSWPRKGPRRNNIRTGRVLNVFPNGLDSGYNVEIRSGLFRYFHAIDHQINTLSFNGYPASLNKGGIV